MKNVAEYLGRLGRLFPEYIEQIRSLAALTDAGADVMSRSCFPAHLTVSGCIISNDRQSVLMIKSPKFDGWLLPGGHIETGEAPVAAALREVEEECALTRNDFVSVSKDPRGMDIHWVEPVPGRGEPRHQHFDLQFVMWFPGNTSRKIDIDEREVIAVCWNSVHQLGSRYGSLYKALTGGQVKP